LNFLERISKGKLYIATDKITKEKKFLRKINLEKANKDFDDGLPTSILREAAILKSLKHQNIAKL
jgi:serine/threonine protein kinase